MARGTNRTKKARQDALLKSLRKGSSVCEAAEAAGINRRQTAYEWRDKDAQFAAAWEDAIEDGTDRMEDEARRRAIDGVEEPVFYKGQQVATVRKKSDTLLIFMLKGRRPDKFREHWEGKLTGDLNVNVHSKIPGPPNSEKEAKA